MDIQSALIRAQKACGWSDEAVADAAGTTTITVKRWKTGDGVPRGDALLALQKKLPGFLDLLMQAVA